MQTELSAMLTVLDADYQLEYSESYTGTVLRGIDSKAVCKEVQYSTSLYKEPLNHYYVKHTPIFINCGVYLCFYLL